MFHSRIFYSFFCSLMIAAELLAMGLWTAGCMRIRRGSSEPQSQYLPDPEPVKEYQLHKIIPYTLRVRRPPVPGADPKVGPGGIDYRTDPLPDAHFDCQAPAWLFRDIKLAELRSCLTAAKSSLTLLYRVKWLPTPYLELDTDDETAGCFKGALPTIPVPREIFFQSNEDRRLECFSSRLKIESNEIASFKLPIQKTAVKVNLPLSKPPQNDDEMRALLLTWALTPFWDNSTGTLTAHWVPDAICTACLGEKTKLGPTDPEPVTWPQ